MNSRLAGRDRFRRRHLGLLQAMVPDDLEARIREHVHRKGDLSRIVREALEMWLEQKRKENKEIVQG